MAQDLARRMDFTEGLVLYDLDGTADRLGVHRATVKRHVSFLRELGALAWARHGSLANLRLPGRPYTATATIYAATIPEVYDVAMGHRLDGHGFRARVVGLTPEGYEGRAAGDVRAAEEKYGSPHPALVGNSDTAASSSGHRAPHSLSGSPDERKAGVDGGRKDTPRDTPRRERAASGASSDSPPAKGGSRPAGDRPRRSPCQVARDIQLARQVRPLVNWTQSEGLRRLAFALRPLIDRGLDAQQIAAELQGLCLGWRPARPAAYIARCLAREAVQPQPAAAGPERSPQPRTEPMANPEWSAWIAARPTAPHVPERDTGLLAPVPPTTAALITGAELAELRRAALTDPALVRTAVDLLGAHEARRTYTDTQVDAVLASAF